MFAKLDLFIFFCLKFVFVMVLQNTKIRFLRYCYICCPADFEKSIFPFTSVHKYIFVFYLLTRLYL